MNEEQQIQIDGQVYDVDSLSPTCKELLVRAQNGQNALAVMGTVFEMARLGQELINSDLKKLLPVEEETPEIAEGELIN